MELGIEVTEKLRPIIDRLLIRPSNYNLVAAINPARIT